MQLDGTKARYFFDGVAMVRHDHYSSPTSPEPTEFPDLSADRLIEDSAAGKRTAETKTC